ncbi:MAG: hypothetical protein ACOVKC_00305 [Brevundimonas sp.]
MSLKLPKGVQAYTIGLSNKAYGGPEEGGWWFDTFEGERVLVAPPGRADALLRRIKLVLAARNREECRYEPGSVLCNGWWDWEAGIVLHYPTERPIYS